jgi:hypothetical protein
MEPKNRGRVMHKKMGTTIGKGDRKKEIKK